VESEVEETANEGPDEQVARKKRIQAALGKMGKAFMGLVDELL